MKKLIFLFLISFFFNSCIPPSDSNRENGKIFHAYVPSGGAVGGLYFALFNDHTYEICGTGGLGQNCYSGNYILRNDTLTMIDLNKDIGLRSNKFLISHYSTPNGRGDLGVVFQLNPNTNQTLEKNETYFVVTIDSLKNSRQQEYFQ